MQSDPANLGHPVPKVHSLELYSGHCLACRKKQMAHWSDSVSSGQMDAGIISTIALLSGQFRQSIRQIQRFLSEQWQLDFSIGVKLKRITPYIMEAELDTWVLIHPDLRGVRRIKAFTHWYI